MATLRGALDALDARRGGDEEAHAWVELAMGAAQDLDDLIASQLKPSAPHPVDAGHALRRALDSLHADVERRGAQVEASGLPRVLADELALARIFQNLVGNSLRHSRSKRIQVEARDRGRFVEFSVRDGGPGPSPAAIAAPAGDPEHGLGIARNLAVAMGGALRIERVGDEGVVRFDVPKEA